MGRRPLLVEGVGRLGRSRVEDGVRVEAVSIVGVEAPDDGFGFGFGSGSGFGFGSKVEVWVEG